MFVQTWGGVKSNFVLILLQPAFLFMLFAYQYNTLEYCYCLNMQTEKRDTLYRNWSVRSPADLGRAIAGARAARGLTQVELAREAGIDRGYLARLEAGASQLVLERSLRALRRMGATVTVTVPVKDSGDDG